MVFGAVFLYLARLTDHLFPGLLGAVAVAVPIATPIPLRSGAFYSDGGRWLRTVRNTGARVVGWALFHLIESAAIQCTFAQIDIADTQPLVDDHDCREQYLGHFYAMHYYQARDATTRDLSDRNTWL